MTQTFDTLDRVVAAVEKGGTKALSRDQLHSLPSAYRRLVSELAEGRARGEPTARLAALEALASRTHAVLYAPSPVRLRKSLIQGVLAYCHHPVS